VLANRLKKVVTGGVFGEAAHVSEGDMPTASLAVVDQSCNENALVAQGLKRHDPELLDQLIVQYQHRLLRYLLYLTGNRETAEDIFQETWMRVLKRGDQFNGKSRFDTWLFTIARNLVIDVRRKRTMSSLEAMREAGEDGRSFDVAADGPSPFEMYQTNENGQRVADARAAASGSAGPPLPRRVIAGRNRTGNAFPVVDGKVEALPRPLRPQTSHLCS
jgi:RNA polymerase sigma-70 factor (ECF subfamily)